MAERGNVAVDQTKFDEAVREYDEARRNLAALFPQPREAAPELGCSFCCRATEEIEASVSGPGVAICEECIALCHELMEERRKGV